MSTPARLAAAWLAALGVALQAMWPLIVQAKPRDTVLVPVCSFGDEPHYIALDIGKGQADPAGEHCPQCWLGADRLVLLSIPRAFAVPETSTAVLPVPNSFSSGKQALLLARPRAPPALS